MKNTKGVAKHSLFIQAVAILLVISITLLWIPFPQSDTPTVVEQSVNSSVDVLDQVDGQNNFIPGQNGGQSTVEKLFAAFDK